MIAQMIRFPMALEKSKDAHGRRQIHTMIRPIYAQVGAVSMNVLFWIVTPVFAVDVMNPVTEGDIKISLPVYIFSLLGTASFTWVVAKYDNERIKKLDRLSQKLDDFINHEKERGP